MNNRLPRCTPEAVGIASEAVEHLLDALEATGTEMHGLMISRFGKVCAEGWWAPYSNRLVHGDQSLTKTYTITALGLLHDEGKLDLEEKLVDIFPQYLPETPSENLKAMTVRNLMSFGSGVNRMISIAETDWLKQFFALPVVHKPGTAYFYSGVCTAVGGAIVRERTGLGLIDYMKPRVFDHIGIDADRIKTIYTGDGLEYGGGGFFTTTEDNLRLMMLYLNHGVWNGKRILSEEWCREICRKQIETASEASGNPGVTDNFMGYGLQCWMCKPAGVYRADGAMGQFSIVIPYLDMVIAINETANQNKLQHQKVLDAIWEEFLPRITAHYLPENQAAAQKLQNRLCRLTLPRPIYNMESKLELSGKTYQMEQNRFILLPATTFMAYGMDTAGVDRVCLIQKDRDTASLSWTQAGQPMEIIIGLNGNYYQNRGCYGPAQLEWLYAIGGWESENTFAVELRMIESCFSRKLRFTFSEDTLTLTSLPVLANPGENSDGDVFTGTALAE